MARGGRGGGSRNPANQSREVQVSRKVSWLLRHGAASEGLKLGKGGYVNVQDAVSFAYSTQSHFETSTGIILLSPFFSYRELEGHHITELAVVNKANTPSSTPEL